MFYQYFSGFIRHFDVFSFKIRAERVTNLVILMSFYFMIMTSITVVDVRNSKYTRTNIIFVKRPNKKKKKTENPSLLQRNACE